MKAIPIEDLAGISSAIHAAALSVGCTHARISEPIWRGPATSGLVGEEMRLVEYSWFRAILLKDAVVFDETEPQKFHAVLREYGLGDVESMQPPEARAEKPAPVEAPVAPALAASPSPARQAVTVYVLPATRTALEDQANQAGLSTGALLDRIFGGSAT